MKIVSSGKGIHSLEFHQKKRRERNIRIAVVVLFVIVFVAIPTYLLKTKRFLISSVEVKGNSVTRTEEIEQIVSGKISGNYLWLFPKSNDVLYPKSDIRNSLLQDIPRLSSVTISLSNPNLLSVSVVERQPFALYCIDISPPTSDSNNSNGCFFLDKTGYVFSEAPSFSGGVYFVYTSEPVFDAPLRQSFLNPVRFGELAPFVSSLGNMGLYPKIFVDKGNEYNLELSNGGKIVIRSDSDLERIVGDLEAFLNSPKIEAEKNFIKRIALLDLRFGNQIRWTLKD